ncbi:hypothetical protein [Reinekea sp.]|jgi:hypothetical protein|uniref:hypothetical protein n=1 Tax=Reinekea sp. TaxID=1970455 RepID=UPI002A81A85B|nr:hypothetical protein [Reinekea sp.]
MLLNLLKDSLNFYRRNVVFLAMIVLPFSISVGLFELVLNQSARPDDDMLANPLIPFMLSLMVYPISQSAVILAIAASVDGRYPSLPSLWRHGLRLWFPVAAVNFLYAAAILGGLFMLVIPGLYFMVRFMFAEYAVVLNKQHPLDAMRASWLLSKGCFKLLLSGFLIITALIYFPALMLTSVLNNLPIAPFFSEFLPSQLFNVLGTFYAVFVFRVFHQAQGEANTTPDA